MNNNDLFDLLKKNGLSERESKVYSALINNPNSTPTQIYNLVGIARTKIYEVLSSLLAKGLVAEELVGKKKSYRTLDPEIAFSSFVRKKENELLMVKENNNKLVTLAIELYKSAELNKSPYYQLEHLSDPASIRDRYQYYVSKAENELLIFSKLPYVTTQGEFDNTLNENLHVRTLVEYRQNKKMDNLITDMIIDPRDEFRFIDKLPVKLSIIDCKITVLALGSIGSKTDQINTIFLNEPIFAQFMKEIFESRWKKGIPLEKFRESMT